MDSFTNLFSLGQGGRANETAQGGCNDGNEQGGRAVSTATWELGAAYDARQ